MSEVMNPDKPLSPSAEPRKRSAEEDKAFEQIFLMPGDWASLFAVPILHVQPSMPKRRTMKHLWDKICFRNSPTHADWLKIVAQLALDAAAHGHGDGGPPVNEQVEQTVAFLMKIFPESAGSSEPDVADCPRLAYRLLAWHLARDYPEPKDRDEALDSLRAAGKKVLGNATDVTLELRRLIYRYLPQPCFEMDNPDSSATNAQTPKPPVYESDPGCLLASAVVGLLERQPTGLTLPHDLIAKLGDEYLLHGSELGNKLRPHWACYLCINKQSDMREQTRYQDYLVRWLAELDQPLCQKLLDDVAAFANRLKTSLKPISVDAYLRELRHKVETCLADKAKCDPAPESAQPEAVNGSTPFEPILAEPFTTVTWAMALESAKRLTSETLDIESILRQPLLFAPSSEVPRRVTIVSDVPECLWFVGDLHGDLLALENAWRFITDCFRTEMKKPHVLFLGDFIDRGDYAHELLLYLFRLIRDNPGQIGVLAGNHDEDLHWDDKVGFSSGTDPSNYCVELNAQRGKRMAEAEFRVKVGQLACHFFERCPRAVFLPDGLLLAHGGFPHTDLLETIRTRDDLGRDDCLQDFVWLRASRAKRKRPNRTTRGCEFGYEDFARFCEKAKSLLVPVRRLLRGHDHVPERWSLIAPSGAPPILTINTMSRRLADEMLGDKPPLACIARYVPNELPEVYQLPITPEEVRKAYLG